jgi:hypothetical protein
MLRFVFRYVVTDRSIAWMNDHRIRWDNRVGHQLSADVTAPMSDAGPPGSGLPA